MIIVHGRNRLADGAERAVVADVLGAMATATRTEPGCLAYRFAFDVEDDRAIHLQEEWDDEFALVAHFDTPHMATFVEAIADLVVGPTDLTVFEAAERELPETG